MAHSHVAKTHLHAKRLVHMKHDDFTYFARIQPKKPKKNTSLNHTYGVATIRRLLKIISLFCKRDLKKRLYSAKKTYNSKEPANRIYPIAI